MCRSIIPLRRKDEPVTRGEIEASALQYVRKIVNIRTPVDRQRVVPADRLRAELAAVSASMEKLLVAAGCEVVDGPDPKAKPRKAGG